MSIGFSSYCFYRELKTQRITIDGVITWAAEQACAHIELVPGLGFEISDSDEARRLARVISAAGLRVSSYTMGANFIAPDRTAFEAEIARVQQAVEFAAILGTTRMRHDLGFRPAAESDDATFAADLPLFVEACQRIADHARQYGIVTSIENHGFHVQHSSRVLQVVETVARDNFGITIDVGNFLCVDESPIDGVRRCAPKASMVHFKDFHTGSPDPDEKGWFRSSSGRALRGAILGEGFLDLPALAKVLVNSGYTGDCSVEFEGREPCETGVQRGLTVLRELWAEAQEACA